MCLLDSSHTVQPRVLKYWYIIPHVLSKNVFLKMICLLNLMIHGSFLFFLKVLSANLKRNYDHKEIEVQLVLHRKKCRVKDPQKYFGENGAITSYNFCFLIY